MTPGNGLTSVPVPRGSSIGEDINGALGDANFSSATFWLDPGVNVITGQFLGVITEGDMNFIAESGVVPESSTWAMMLLGFAGLGYAGYRARRSAVLIA